MLHIIIYAIVPIFVVMIAGFIAGKKGAFSGKDAKALIRLCSTLHCRQPFSFRLSMQAVRCSCAISSYR